MIPVWPYIWYVSEISWLQIYDDYELLDYEYAGPEKRLTSMRKDVGRDLVVFLGVLWHYLQNVRLCGSVWVPRLIIPLIKEFIEKAVANYF